MMKDHKAEHLLKVATPENNILPVGFLLQDCSEGDEAVVGSVGAMEMPFATKERECVDLAKVFAAEARAMGYEVPRKFALAAGEIFYKNGKVEEVRLRGAEVAGDEDQNGKSSWTRWETPTPPKASYSSESLTLSPEDHGRTFTLVQSTGVALRVIWDLRGNDLMSRQQGMHEPPRASISSLASRDHLAVCSSNTYQALREALALNTFKHSEESPWPTARLDKGDTTGFAQLRPGIADTRLPVDQEAAFAGLMWSQREQLSDLDTDALDALSAVWLHQARHEGDDAEVEVDDLLRLRGLTPKKGGDGRRGGYGPDQRAEMLAAVSRVMSLWLNVAQVEVQESERKRNRKTESIQSRPFVMSERMGQLNLSGSMDVSRFIFRPGRVFSRYLLGPGRMVALLAAQALKYDPYRQPFEKRLAKYLSWQWKIRAKRGTYMQPYKVRTLIDATQIPFNQRQPGKTRERMEKALDALKADDVFADWQYEGWDEEVAGKRGWAEKWLDVRILIEPPELVREHYDSHYRKFDVQTPDKFQKSALSSRLGLRIKEHRKANRISQMRAAEDLDISQSYLSQIERGREVKIAEGVHKRIEAWLSQ